MKHQNKKIGVTDILLLAISLVFVVGITTVFKPCGPTEEGTWMSCHWAGHAVAGVAAVLAVIAVIHLFASDAKLKLGLDLAMIPAAALSALIPGRLISLCMMNNMRCNALMRPAAIVLSVLLIAAAAGDALLRRKGNE